MEKNTPPRYVNGVSTNVGMIEMSSNDFAKIALNSPAIEKMRSAVHGPGVKVYPSLANFVLIDCGKPSPPIYDKLLRMGVIVRPMAAWGLPHHIRVSVAAHQELPRVIEALNQALA